MTLKEKFGIGSLGKTLKDPEQFTKREKLKIWIKDKRTGYGGQYIGHYSNGMILIRWDRSNPKRLEPRGLAFGASVGNAGTHIFSKKTFFKYGKVIRKK